jgi:3-hydroxyisobutyrate dehydrogenase-like beta-hydroxyacid dehydrogenase
VAVGMIGLGLMGRAVAERLLAAGHAVVGCDIAEGPRRLAEGLGVRVVGEAREVAAEARIVVLALLTSEDRRRLLFGEQALAAALADGAVLLDVSTGRPGDLVEDHARLAERGVRLVDACIVGSSQVASEGQAVAFVGDREADGAAYDALLATVAKERYYLGGPGAGCRAKLVANLVIGLHRMVLAEALGLAEAAGLDPAQALAVLRAGGTHSAVMDAKGPRMLARDYEPPAARLSQHAKDVGLILELAEEVGASVPLTQAHAPIIEGLVAAGLGGLDNAAIYEAFAPTPRCGSD